MIFVLNGYRGLVIPSRRRRSSRSAGERPRTPGAIDINKPGGRKSLPLTKKPTLLPSPQATTRRSLGKNMSHHLPRRQSPSGCTNLDDALLSFQDACLGKAMEILDSVSRQKSAALNSKKFLELKKQRKALRDQFACMEKT